ncbi:hypothetical protein F0M18_10645 [Pseudohalioglobus sediminis]|uniref:Porin n=1 Tax=Pseudohalioglobus sediminis TaxID=2606449 RepID=A0A5B0WY01_9GAMM|nr:porin [Pseudohalioglobus sediminis]KAA1191972.1 hypothetical protein F0M18_10645 [Pseudohalioglobus sediminis]
MAFALSAQAFAPLPIHAAEAQRILLRNVGLIEPADAGATVTVNLLIEDGKLELVTQDAVSSQKIDSSYDIAGGVVLGTLSLGEPASFLILDGDPRENVELLLDTRTHARFAIHQGEVLKNNYSPTSRGSVDEGKQQGWLAYTPPPLAVPLNYQDKSRWNRYDGKYVSGLFSGAVVLDRQRWLDQDRNSMDQVGDLTAFEGGEIRALRFGAVGTFNFEQPWVWVIAGATHAFDKGFDQVDSDDFTLFDLRLDIPLWQSAGFSIGKQKEPISMERLMPMTNLPMQERAAVSDALLPSRNIGAVFSGTLPGDRATFAGGVFNNWLDKDQPSSPGDNSSQLVGRLTWVPLVSKNENSLLHLGAGARHSSAREPGFLRTVPEFNNAPNFVETGLLDVEGIDTWSLEASMRSGPFWLHSEYLQMDLESDAYGDPTLDGYHVTASWILTGEVRPYNWRTGLFKGIPIAATVDQNGWGAWEIGARFSHLDLSEVPGPEVGDAGEMDIWSLGVNWWLSPYFNVNLNYRYISLDRFGDEGISQGMNARLMLVLE